MPDVTFKDLCLDAGDAEALATFWAHLLHRKAERADDEGGWRVDPPAHGPDALGIWVDPVPEPRTGKTRVHLDVRLPDADVGPLLAQGARLVREPDDEIRWWVLADPEGNEFCAMAPAAPEYGLPTVTVPAAFELVVDAADPEAQARWWAERTGGTARTRGSGFWWIEGAAGLPWDYWVFNPVPEAKTVKNRMHWDTTLRGDDPAALVDAGARVLRSPGQELEWWVLADPEGNEFCAFPLGSG
ncbi:MAG: hypothetical protein GC157_18340 [Frankiales bacterium]|nr:hypothetical protein [Frankiales bacterium]